MLNKNRHAVPAADTLRPFLPFGIVLQFFSNYQLYLQSLLRTEVDRCNYWLCKWVLTPDEARDCAADGLNLMEHIMVLMHVRVIFLGCEKQQVKQYTRRVYVSFKVFTLTKIHHIDL